MNGSSPPPPPPNPRARNSKSSPSSKPTRAVRRRRPGRALTPWPQLILLCSLYIVIGLVLSMPEPPPWVWLVTAIAIPLMALGLTPSFDFANKSLKRKHRVGVLSYLGGLLLVVALSVAVNYIGSDQNLDQIGFSSALIGLGLLTLLSVVLTAATAIATAQVGSRLMGSAQYWRSVTMVVVTSLVGLCVGGLAGLFIITPV
ncbi:hypothetical protein [cf. Phormidesmis sp. LEGE 11477]|uniref:hypothetical protein n=1 Tax=cf. Phormidesmis sp. LEGE 11477 TaxID=1828680 RepID=UPI00187E6A4B|nr:hypothetical protein [cf. Phormidesmis sp. LEGE 11477]MBE9062474.1 hypothetical protein [cf. Phormidesmis sp. LEGE 11477]